MKKMEMRLLLELVRMDRRLLLERVTRKMARTLLLEVARGWKRLL